MHVQDFFFSCNIGIIIIIVIQDTNYIGQTVSISMVIVLGNYVVIIVFVDCIYNVLLYMLLLFNYIGHTKHTKT